MCIYVHVNMYLNRSGKLLPMLIKRYRTKTITARGNKTYTYISFKERIRITVTSYALSPMETPEIGIPILLVYIHHNESLIERTSLNQ